MHYNYGHTPFNILQYMDINGVQPNSLADFPFPVSTACLYSKSIKIPRKTKTARVTVYMLMYWSLAFLASLLRCLDLSRINATIIHACLWVIILTSHMYIYQSIKLEMK